jgi:hypothetical protein
MSQPAALSDGWRGYRKLHEKGFEHTATVLASQDKPAHTLLGTHHQVQPKHLKRMSPSSTTGSTAEPWNQTSCLDSSQPASEHTPLHFTNLQPTPELAKYSSSTNVRKSQYYWASTLTFPLLVRLSPFA